ncbi:hypothetical protein QBC36DRAFT_287259 [Triangularia setosa]|uniref:Uncharacterized protein n=1 Tax=Triangularia setosa TaxID=2587417 RepID=A0AAN7AB87_9PEZI|nr:hypothetical protein QBC36DRAFT_287259 [Podospora setosa]
MFKAINYGDYTVACMCFNELVETALLLMLDEEHGSAPRHSQLQGIIQQFIFDRASEIVIHQGDVIVSNLTVDYGLNHLRGVSIAQFLGRIETEIEGVDIYRNTNSEPGGHEPRLVVFPNTKGLGVSPFGDTTLRKLVWDIETPSILV